MPLAMSWNLGSLRSGSHRGLFLIASRAGSLCLDGRRQVRQSAVDIAQPHGRQRHLHVGDALATVQDARNRTRDATANSCSGRFRRRPPAGPAPLPGSRASRPGWRATGPPGHRPRPHSHPAASGTPRDRTRPARQAVRPRRSQRTRRRHCRTGRPPSTGRRPGCGRAAGNAFRSGWTPIPSAA